MDDFNTSEIRETYYSEIRSMAEDYQSRIEKGDFEDRDAFLQDVHETIDSHQFVIYTHKAQCVALASSNSGAVADLGIEIATKDGEIQWSVIAYCAMERDLYEALDWLGVDINDETTWGREGEEEEEEEEGDHTPTK